MSISSEITRIANEVDTQADLIRQIRTALNGKVAGGESIEPSLQDKTIKENGTYTADEGYDGLGTVIVDVEVDIPEPGGGGTDTRFADLVMDNLTAIDDETITTLRPYAICYAEKLVSIRLPNARISATSVFRNCTNLLSVDLPELAGTSGGSLFVYCSSLTSVNIPKVTSISSYDFQYCTALRKIDLGNVTSINAGAFNNSGLETLIIRRTGTSNTTLSSTNAFDGTPIGNGTGYIYVYRDLIDKFKTATNWNTYANQFRAIEDYPDICGG